MQFVEDFFIQSQRFDRQSGDRLGRRREVDIEKSMMTDECECPGRAGGRQRHLCGDAKALQRGFDAFNQAGHATKKLFATGKIEKQNGRGSIGVIVDSIPPTRNDRRKANEPSAKGIESAAIGRGIFGDAAHAGADALASAALMPWRTPCD